MSNEKMCNEKNSKPSDYQYNKGYSEPFDIIKIIQLGRKEKNNDHRRKSE